MTFAARPRKTFCSNLLTTYHVVQKSIAQALQIDPANVVILNIICALTPARLLSGCSNDKVSVKYGIKDPTNGITPQSVSNIAGQLPALLNGKFKAANVAVTVWCAKVPPRECPCVPVEKFEAQPSIRTPRFSFSSMPLLSGAFLGMVGLMAVGMTVLWVRRGQRSTREDPGSAALKQADSEEDDFPE